MLTQLRGTGAEPEGLPSRQADCRLQDVQPAQVLHALASHARLSPLPWRDVTAPYHDARVTPSPTSSSTSPTSFISTTLSSLLLGSGVGVTVCIMNYLLCQIPLFVVALSLSLSLFLSTALALARSLSLFLSTALALARARALPLSLALSRSRSRSLALSPSPSLSLSLSLSCARALLSLSPSLDRSTLRCLPYRQGSYEYDWHTIVFVV